MRTALAAVGFPHFPAWQESQSRLPRPSPAMGSTSQPDANLVGCMLIAWCWARHLSQSFHGCVSGSLVHVLKPFAQSPYKTYMVRCCHRTSSSPLLARFWSTQRSACSTDESLCFSLAYTARRSCEIHVQATSPPHHPPLRESHMQPL